LGAFEETLMFRTFLGKVKKLRAFLEKLQSSEAFGGK